MTNQKLTNMLMAEYNADPCPEPSLRSSLIKVIVAQSVYHAKQKHPRLTQHIAEEHNPAFDLGTAAHQLVVGGDTKIAVVDAPDWRTKKAQEQRDESYANGLTPILAKHNRKVIAMRDALFDQLQSTEHHDAFRAGDPEVTFLWKEDVWFRSRPDWVCDGTFYDYKTVGVSCAPRNLERYMFDRGYDIQAALMQRAADAVLGRDESRVFRYICQEVEYPHRMTVIGFSPMAMAYAEQKIHRAAKAWRTALELGHWPAYPTETCWIDPPAWEMAAAEEAQ